MKIMWAHKTNSFKKAKEFEDKYYRAESPEARLSDLQFCREIYFKLKGLKNESRKRLRRVIRIAKQI